VYADARIERDHELSCRAVALRLPPAAAISGPSAAYLHGVSYAAAPHDDVHVTMPPPGRLSPRQGVVVHAVALGRPEMTMISGLPVTTAPRTAWDVGAWLDPVTAVPIIDGMLGRGLVNATRLADLAGHRRRERAGRRAAEALLLADGAAKTPAESRLRVRLVLAGLPRPVIRHPVVLPTGMTDRPDLAWPEFRVAVEYDASPHLDPDQARRDRHRLNQFAAGGWIVLRVTPERLRRDFTGLVRELHAALRDRGWRG
jgi:hypothetical protein